MRNLLEAIKNKFAKGRVLGGETLKFSHESADDFHSVSSHSEVPVSQLARETFVGPRETMEDKFSATISLVVTRADGTQFADFHNNYHNMALDDVLELEEIGTNLQKALLDVGKRKRDEKQGKVAKG
jgi:hypothetical protein